MKTKTFIYSIVILISRTFAFGQNLDSLTIGQFEFTLGYSSSTLKFNSNQFYILTANSCKTSCQMRGKWSNSNDTIKLNEPISVTGTNDCMIWFNFYSTLCYRDNRLVILKCDSLDKDKFFYSKMAKKQLGTNTR